MRSLVLSALCVLHVGCASLLHPTAQSVLSSQTPGRALGAGASIVGPSNAAAPTTQKAEKREAFYPPFVPSEPSPSPTLAVSVPVIEPPATPPRYPAWTYEKVETSFGQHQDAAGIVKVAQSAAGWPALRWIGLLCIIVGIGGILHSMNNHETGYPIVWIKVAALGIFFIFAGDNPFWLLLLLLPIGFYVVQKLGLWKLPPP